MSDYKITIGTELTGTEKLDHLEKKIQELKSETINVDVKLTANASDITRQLNKQFGDKLGIDAKVDVNPVVDKSAFSKTMSQLKADVSKSMSGAAKFKPVLDESYLPKLSADIDKRLNKIGNLYNSKKYSKTVMNGEIESLTRDLGRWDAIMREIDPSELPLKMRHSLALTQQSIDEFFSSFDNKQIDLNIDEQIRKEAEKAKAEIKSIEKFMGKYDSGKIFADLDKQMDRYDKFGAGSRKHLESLKNELDGWRSSGFRDAIQGFSQTGDLESFERKIKDFDGTFAKFKNGLDSVDVAQKKIKRNIKDINSSNKLSDSKNIFGLQIDKWLNDNSAAVEQFGDRINGIKKRIAECNDGASLGRLKSEFQQVKLEADLAGKSTKTFGDKIKEQISEYGVYAVVAAGLAASVQAFSAMAKEVLEVDTAMTGLYRVTDLTSQQYDKLYSNMISSAKEYGATLTDTINATSDWVRAGFDADTALELADITAMYQHISDLDYAEASKNLLTSYNGFKDTFNKDFGGDVSASVMHVTDVLNELDNKFSVTSAGLGEGLARSASALQMAGNTFEQSAAMIGATAEIQQDPEKAGQAMKVLSLRIRGMKGELEELGEESEGVENISKMQGQILNMTKGKVNIFGDNGEFRSTYDIMKDIASIYDELTSTDRANLLETLAGKNRANDVAALIENFDTAIKMAETAENSTGSAARENAKYVDSLQGRIDIMTASLQAFSNTAMNSDFLKGGVSAITGIIDAFTKLVDVVGGLPTLLGAGAAAFSLFNKGIVTVDKTATGAMNKFKLFGSSISDIKGMIGELLSGSGLAGALSFGREDVFSGFKDRLSKDKQDLKDFIDKLSIGDKTGAAAVYNQSGGFVKEYIDNTDDATRSVAAFEEAQKQSFVQLQASNNSLKSSSGVINEYNAGCKNVSMSQKDFADSVGQVNPVMGNYLSNLNGAKASMGGYIKSLVASKAATIALTAASTALNMVLTMGIGLVVGAAINAIDKWIHAEEKLAESVDDATSSYKQQHEELSKGKSEFDKAAASYEKLHDGVSKLNGENISLTPDEYDEYINAANTIADMVPSLVSGYDAQGNAILDCAGDVDTLTDAYNKLIVAENNKLLNGDGEDYKGISDISKDLGNFYDDSKKEAEAWADGLEKVFESNDFSADSIISNIGVGTKQAALSVVKAMEDANKTIEGVSAPNDWTNQQDSAKYLAEVYKQYPEVIRSVIGDVSAEMDSAVEEMRAAISAHMENAFINQDYKNLDEDMKSIASSIVGGIDSGVIAELNESGGENAVISYVNNILSALDTMGLDAQKKLKSAFDLESSFKNGDINFGEYKKQIDEIESTIDSLDVDTKIKDQLKESLNIDGVKDEYHSLIARLEELGVEGAASFAEGLSSTELSAAYDVIADIGDVKIDGNELKKKIEDAAELQEAMNYTIDIEAETGGIDALNSALAESRSATGLTIESMDALKDRYKELGTYDAATLFEETANGISLNAEAVNKYEQELADTKLDETTQNLDTLKNRYDELTNEIADCTDTAEKSKLINEREDVRKHIAELAELATAYEGLTSSYAEWQRAESAGNDRDLYANVHSAMEGIGKELENGWIDDGTKEYFQLIWGEDKWDGAGKSVQDYRDKWGTLNDTIQGTSYSIQDFFKTNKDGELTSEGIFNFFDAVDQVEDKIGRDVIKKDDNGNIVSFDFGVDGDKAIADALGISEELVQIFLRASRDAGFVVNFDGTYTQLANLQNEAMAAQDKYNEIFGKEYSFNFNTQSLKEAQDDLKEAKKLLENEDFWNHDADGNRTTFNFDAKGAKEAMQMVSTLQAMVDNLDNKYIGITVEDKQFEEPLEKAQDYEAKVDELNQLELNPKANAADIDSLKEDISEIVNYFAKLDDKTKKKLNIPVDLKGEELDNKIKEMLDNGTLEIPTTLDIQTNIDESIEDLRDLALLNSGILDDKQKAEIEAKFKVRLENEDIEKQINEALKNAGITDKKEVEIGTKFFADTQDIQDYKPEQIEAVVKFVKDIDDIENYKPEAKQAIAKFIKDVEDVENYSPEQKEAIAKYVKDVVDIESYTPENKKAICDFIVNNEDVMAYTPEEKAAIAKYLADPQDVDAYEPADKAAITKFLADHGDVDAYNPSDKQALATFLLNNALVEGYQPTDKDLDVIAEVDKSNVDSYQPPSKTMTIWATVKKAASDLWGLVTGANSVDGTAHINGTAYVNGSTGRAFKHGSWDTKDSGTALMGELGQETIVRNGRFFTVGDNGAEFVKYKRGDVIFNHKILFCGVA